MDIARAELMALLYAVAQNMNPEVAAQRAQLNAEIQAELEYHNRTRYGTFA
jgi:hypothetical protein